MAAESIDAGCCIIGDEAFELAGPLCIGDATHAMSSVGHVGIDLAIQDVVATANLFLPELGRGPASEARLAAVQRPRDLLARLAQALQANAHASVRSVVCAGAVTAARRRRRHHELA
jgi:2-polyprenyl-6-methoxyphenol hydroxylase-like FAD-dependent oxidoreductase